MAADRLPAQGPWKKSRGGAGPRPRKRAAAAGENTEMNTEKISDALDPAEAAIRRLAPGGKVDFRGSARYDYDGGSEWMLRDRQSGVSVKLALGRGSKWWVAIAFFHTSKSPYRYGESPEKALLNAIETLFRKGKTT